jgi:Uncharacterized conserved protein (DUF2075).
MPAYARRTIGQIIHDDAAAIVGTLQQAYAVDGFASQYTRQTQAWARVIPKLQQTFVQLLKVRPEACDWTVLLEYPLYRLRRRIDIVILACNLVVVVECKVGADVFTAQDRRQVEEYALDLRDFHAESRCRGIVPVLWSTDATSASGSVDNLAIRPPTTAVEAVTQVGAEGLETFLAALPQADMEASLSGETWDRSAYRPVPNVIEAATSIFAGHDVRSIANADADNLQSAAARLVELIKQAREQGKRCLLMLTGVPGSGKTLAGLHVVHSAVAMGVERHGDIIYLSGNTPLVVVLREALARDQQLRCRAGRRKSLGDIRREVRVRIQHISDFLQEGLRGSPENPPHEHVIVFDEAQRAWDEKQGLKKFERTASEPAILLDLMSRHNDWCACICLIGGGQEINSGEEGVFGWGEALRRMQADDRQRWNIFAPPDVVHGGASAGTFTLGELPPDVEVGIETDLQLKVPQRSYRSPSLSRWVDYVLAGNAVAAQAAAQNLREYPVVITRSLSQAKSWLRERGRGERRYGLVASSGARRLRAQGLGATLNASAGDEIAQWYLNPPGDIRSSYALEVAANEYTCQGLELDFACICWGGDLLWTDALHTWTFSRLSGTAWQRVHGLGTQRFLSNSYRVLLTRAREGLVLWIPDGDDSDSTRSPGPLDDTATFLMRCGAVPIATS